ncbi:hypothetical protein [Priestia megaterium]|uniref:hypothetical protein n=1 Tax=Priestia megaterium TaxID=1404 RepID=UPI0005C77A93|nr:hypothetical protein [Priestia megaterium]
MCGCSPQDVQVVNTFEEPVVTENSQARAAVARRNYFVMILRQTVGNDASFFLQITNPAGSVGRIAETANTNTVITLNRNGSFAGGVGLTPVNSNFGSAITSVATAKLLNQVADLTFGGEFFNTLFSM